MSGVTTKHPLYSKRYPQWILMRDVIEGNDAIKAQGEIYLPKPSIEHDKFSLYAQKQYEAFKFRTPFIDFTAQVKDCLHGMLENTPARIEVPQKVKEILNNVDYQGNSCDQFISNCIEDVLITSFGGCLVDAPRVNPNMSKLQAEKQKIRPYLSYYNAESITFWDYKVINGIKTLSLVVLQEKVKKDNKDLFCIATKTVYRVLFLNENNVYAQSIFESSKDDKGNEIYLPTSTIVPEINGKPLNYIPFVLFPFNEPVKPILYDIAIANLHHYVVSADYQNGAHLTSRPTGYFTGHQPELDDEGNTIPVYVGTNVFWQLPEPEAKVGVCSFSGEGIEHLEKELDRTESQIFTLASHIISQDKKTAENKDAVNLRRAGEDAKIATFGKNMSYRFTQLLKMIAEWMNEDTEDVIVEINTDFSNLSFDANAVNSIANIFSQGKLPLRCLYYLLRSSHYLEPDMTYEDFVYLLDLESASLSPTEVDTAYKKFKRTGQKIKVETSDWYSPEDLYSDKDKKDVEPKE